MTRLLKNSVGVTIDIFSKLKYYFAEYDQILSTTI